MKVVETYQGSSQKLEITEAEICTSRGNIKAAPEPVTAEIDQPTTTRHDQLETREVQRRVVDHVERVSHRKVDHVVDEIKIVPKKVIQEVVVLEAKECTVECPAVVEKGTPMILEQIEEIEGEVVYVDNIVQEYVDYNVDEPRIEEITTIVPKEVEVINMIPEFIDVETTIERLVQVPEERRIERTVNVPVIQIQEQVEWEEVELIEEIPKVVEEVKHVKRLVQKPRYITEELVVEIPKVDITEKEVIQHVPIREEVIIERAIECADSVVVEKEVEVSNIIRREKVVEVPEVQYEKVVVERPLHRFIKKDVPVAPTYEIVKKQVKIPRIEYRDKVVQIPREKKIDKKTVVENRVCEKEIHRIYGEPNDPGIVKYIEKFVEVPKIRHVKVNVPVQKIKVVDKKEVVPIDVEVIKYVEQPQVVNVKVLKQRHVPKKVEVIYPVPKYIFYDEVVPVEIRQEVLVIQHKIKQEEVECMRQIGVNEEVPKPVLCGVRPAPVGCLAPPMTATVQNQNQICVLQDQEELRIRPSSVGGTLTSNALCDDNPGITATVGASAAAKAALEGQPIMRLSSPLVTDPTGVTDVSRGAPEAPFQEVPAQIVRSPGESIVRKRTQPMQGMPTTVRAERATTSTHSVVHTAWHQELWTQLAETLQDGNEHIRQANELMKRENEILQGSRRQ
jgi:hypothetical protein